MKRSQRSRQPFWRLFFAKGNTLKLMRCSWCSAPVVALFAVMSSSLFAQTVQVIESRADQSVLLAHHTTAFRSNEPTHSAVQIKVDETVRFQPMDGFGASMTDSSASILMALPQKDRNDLLQEMFAPSGPLGITLLRQPIGASDFSAHGDYSYDDPPDGKPDLGLEKFGAGNDAAELFPLLREALHLNPELRFVVLPWSAPAWMKNSHTMRGGTLQDKYLPSYAQYLARTVDLYATEGLPVFALSLQNEPLNENASYPTQLMDPTQEANLASLLRPLLWKEGRAPLLFGYEHNWNNLEYPDKLINEAQRLIPQGSPQLFAGISFHCYAGNESAQLTLLRDHPQTGVWFTECSETNGTNFADDFLWESRHLLLGAPLNGARSVFFWNLLLNSHGGPHNGGCRDCRGLLTADLHGDNVSVQRSATYYELAHISPYVHPHAIHIAATFTSKTSLQTVAFQNRDGTMVLLVLNSDPQEAALTISWNGKSATYTAAGRSLLTFSWGEPKTEIQDGTYRLTNDTDGMEYLEGVPGALVPALHSAPTDIMAAARQLWTLHRLPGNRFEIRNVATAQALSVDSSNHLVSVTVDGAHVAPVSIRQDGDTVCLSLSEKTGCPQPGANIAPSRISTRFHLLAPVDEWQTDKK